MGRFGAASTEAARCRREQSELSGSNAQCAIVGEAWRSECQSFGTRTYVELVDRPSGRPTEIPPTNSFHSVWVSLARRLSSCSLDTSTHATSATQLCVKYSKHKSLLRTSMVITAMHVEHHCEAIDQTTWRNCPRRRETRGDLGALLSMKGQNAVSHDSIDQNHNSTMPHGRTVHQHQTRSEIGDATRVSTATTGYRATLLNARDILTPAAARCGRPMLTTRA